MDIRILTAALLAAILRRQFPAVGIKEQISEGLKVLKDFSLDEATAREAGNEPTTETAVVKLDKVATGGAGAYQVIATWTVSAGKTGILNKIEMASADYDNVQFKLTVAGELMFTDKLLPNATTLTLPELNIRGGKITKIEAKDTDSTTHNVWGDITGKEVV